MAKNDEMEVVVSTSPSDMINKYKEMANMRRDFEDLDIKDCIPTLDEMIKSDLMYDILEGVANGETEQDVLSTAYYIDQPPTMELGYHNDLNVFIYKVKVNLSENDIKLNKLDGDTFRVPLDSVIEPLNSEFTMNNGESYSSFKDYCYSKGLVDESADADKRMLQIRLVGVNTPEIPHYDIQVMKKSDIVSMTLDEARKKNANIKKYTDSGLERNEDGKIDFYKVKNSSGGYSYHEIIGDASEYLDTNVSNCVCKKIVVYDDSEKSSVVGGYKAQQNLIDLVNGQTVYLMLDANGAKANKTSSKYKLYYNHWWNLAATVGDMIDQWCDYTNETTLTKLSYSPYGTDGYGRFLGAAYVSEGELYTNVAKYNIADSETKSVANPDVTSSPELNNLGSDTAAAFKLYTYNKNNQLWLDSFSEMTKESYNARIEFHKEVSGIDFTKVRDCTMFLGDTLFLIPPQNIRSLSSIDYERVGIMRGKGSMIKNSTNRDMYLEVDLYFYNGDGVNGIKKDVELPNGQEVTYHMNGLRSLIAQFKLAPYLPIENRFINDVLNIEAVSLVNLSVSTVEGMPRLLRATLTLRDFNYRIYMPDIPIDYSNNEVSEITEMNPIFAKCFNWEVFRFYYQRIISYGEALKEYDYNSPTYLKELYSKKEALQPVYFCEKDGFNSSAISFYTPDENWLKAALAYKKDKEFYGQTVIPVEKTEAANEWIDSLATTASCLNMLSDSTVTSNINKLYADNISLRTIMNLQLNDVLTSRSTNLKSNNVSNVMTHYIDLILSPIIDQAASTDVVSGVTVNEVTDIDNMKLKYEIALSLNTNKLSTIDKEAIKESVRDVLGMDNIIGIFRDSKLVFNIDFKLKNSNSTYKLDTSSMPTLSGREVANKEDVTINDLDILNAFATNKISTNPDDKTTNESLGETYDYLEPSAMQFLPYLENVELTSLSFSLTNTFGDITLKIMDGFAPQYMGSSDIIIELSLITKDDVVVSMLNALPAHASNIGKLYRRILSCWPIRVRNHYLQMAGVNEVLIDLIEVQTVQGFPGTYEIRMRLTSVDRTMRQRETLKQLESDEKSSSKAVASLYSYWDLNKVLSSAELYPDLDLPSLKELEEYGFNFIRYRGSNQAYPDPDFYMSYSWPYTSYIIKKNLKDVFYNSIFHDEGKDKSEILDDTAYEFFDQMGMTLYQKLDPVTGMNEAEGADGKKQNELADTFDEIMAIIDSGAKETIEKADRSKNKKVEEEKDCANLSDLLIYLTACDIQQGWSLKPGFTVPIVINELNLDVEKLECSGIPHDEVDESEKTCVYAQEVFDLRTEAIKAIDDYLSDPISYDRYSYSIFTDGVQTMGYGELIARVVNTFVGESKAQKILQLLNPFETNFAVDPMPAHSSPGMTVGVDEVFSKIKYDEANSANYLVGFLYSAAKAISGNDVFDTSTSTNLWEPRQFVIDEHGKAKKDKDGNYVPNCKIERNGKPIAFAETLDESLNQGIQWGMFQIKRYRTADLKKIMKPASRVAYLPENEQSMYKDKDGKERWHPGFIDPYYNIAGYKSKIGKEYIKKIATNEGINTIAFIRTVLMHLRRMIIDGQIFSEIDIVANDYDEITQTVLDAHVDLGDSWDGTLEKWKEMGMDILTLPYDIVVNLLSSPIEGLGKLGYDLFLDNTVDYLDDVNASARMKSITDAMGGDEVKAGTISELVEELPETYKRSFCARLVLPIIMATTARDKELDTMINNYELKELNSLTMGAVISSSEPISLVSRYCSAMNSIGMLDFSKAKTDPETTSDSQKLWNYIMREAYTKLADDPQAYILHSYYDMLVNDKRGRLVRAFPTYYIVFVDEGRKIGSWKLFDNFYNMSAISEITVSKSRKIAADTCSFVMSNMYTSYAATYDNTTRQQYVDVYGLRDVFNSIMCPESYFLKEDSLRRRKESLETVILQPGVRIHVRMGYGSDAGTLPVVFNGKIAEIDVSEVVQVIAQGDGIELSNPLNTLGEIDAVELTEAQAWTTIFKDLRGSLKRGGESPRNLLSKLLTARYGGVFKTVVRELVSNGRWYGDNPFGIYHFGDNRFNSIFLEGETVQNLYEICDSNLLKGSNELYTSKENSMATPTINTTLQDKTFWDILHLCANSGINYMGAIRDFGMRSTVCLCKPNQYYAWAYKRIDDENGQTEGKIVERRKPFQQYHYYDSYTDIVYNSIKASEKNMKTNATGIWESTDLIWGKSQATVGPIYLDMNIYPEHQRSMTVDTTLVSDGAGGLELNFITHFSENWKSDANDNKVNKALAERVTTNVLKESVSNMYCGEICVLGDTSIKPYDRFYVNDVYEDMQGHMEVEGVVYSMNSSTGFTTTVYPDAIVRMSEDTHESATRIVSGTMLSSFGISITGRLMGINTFARMDSKLLSALGKGIATATGTPIDELAAGVLGKFITTGGGAQTYAAAAKSALAAGLSTASIATTVVAAIGIFVLANNAKSWFGSFLKNINALSVYPITKNQRPLIAGMAGHKGSVMGYEYTKEDKDDSIQGLIVNAVDWLNKGNDKFEKVFPFEFGDILMDMFTRKVDDGNGNKISEYELMKRKWAQTLPQINSDLTEEELTNLSYEQQVERLVQMIYGASNSEFSTRNEMTSALRTKWRIPSLLVSESDKLADETYKKYYIGDILSLDMLKTSEKVLALSPIEDEADIKQAVIEGAHANIKQLHIAHMQGNYKLQIPFESGNRIIKFFVEQDGEDGYIFDLPMLQEDALRILKYIINDQALKNKVVTFLSGTRINDKKTWKSTGFAFILQSEDKSALKSALDQVMKQTTSLTKEGTPIFEYKESDGGFLIIVYAPIEAYNGFTSTKPTDTNESNKTTNKTTEKDKGKEENKKPADNNNNNNNNSTIDPNTNVSLGKQQALRKAQDYLDYTAFSKQGLYDQLISEYGGQFKPDEAQYAVDNIGANWKQQALRKAQDYLDYTAFSKQGLYDQLISESGSQFKPDEAQYAVDNIRANWKQQALRKAQEYLDYTSFSKQGLYDQLISEYGSQFKPDEAQYAVDQLFK